MKHTNEEISPRLIEAVRDWWCGSHSWEGGHNTKLETLRIAGYPLTELVKGWRGKKDPIATYDTDHKLELSRSQKGAFLEHTYGRISERDHRYWWARTPLDTVAVFLPISHRTRRFGDCTILHVPRDVGVMPEDRHGERDTNSIFLSAVLEFGFLLPRNAGCDADVDMARLNLEAYEWKRNVWMAAGCYEEKMWGQLPTRVITPADAAAELLRRRKEAA